MVIAGAALLAFFAFSQGHHIPFARSAFIHPPVYGRWKLVVDAFALLTVPAAIILGLIAGFVTSGHRVPAWAALTLIIVGGVVTAAAVGLVRGHLGDLTRAMRPNPPGSHYPSDLRYLYAYGVRGFVEKRPELLLSYYNARTHPSGILVLLYLLFRTIGGSHTGRIAAVIAVLSMAAAISAWSIGRTLAGERAGRIAAALAVAAPGMLVLAYGAVEGIYGTVLTAAAALLMLAIYRTSLSWSIAAGVALGFSMFFTYATVFVGLAAAVAVVAAVVFQRVGVRPAAKTLGGVAIGGVAMLGALRLALGWNLFAEFATVPTVSWPYDPYWILGSPAAFLIYAGLPLAGIGVAGMFVKVPGARRPVLPLALFAIMVAWAGLPTGITHLRPGEVERTWIFLYPILAGCAAPVIDRWTADKGRWRGAIIGGLVVISVAQAVLLHMRLDNQL